MLSPCRAPSAFGTAAPAAGPVAAGRSSTLELARARAPVPSAPVPPRSGTRSERESEGDRAEKRGEHESPHGSTVKRRAARASPPQDSPLPARSRARPGRPSRSRPAASPPRRLARRKCTPPERRAAPPKRQRGTCQVRQLPSSPGRRPRHWRRRATPAAPRCGKVCNGRRELGES